MADAECRIVVATDSARASTFDVAILEGKSRSDHRVTLSSDDALRFAPFEPSHIVEAAFAFLLDREPKEQILAAFDIGVIRRYFSDFDRAFPEYLSRAGRSRPAQKRNARREDE